MSEDDRIGRWVTRERDSGRMTRPHLVESVIDDEPVTRCGRRMRTRSGTWFHYSSSTPIRLCTGCQ